MPEEPIFLEEPVFLKTLPNSFSQIHGICSHQCQESSSATDSVKKPSGTRTSTQILTNRPCALPTLFHLLYFRLFKIILEILNLWWEEKSHRNVQKKKESSISKWQRFFPSLNGEGSLTGTPNISSSVELLVGKQMQNDDVNYLEIIWQSKRILSIQKWLFIKNPQNKPEMKKGWK